MKVAAKDGFVHIHELQLSGKKRMKTEDFLRGYNFEDIVLY
jgi:methionyl-tRNA formyltransferase